MFRDGKRRKKSHPCFILLASDAAIHLYNIFCEMSLVEETKSRKSPSLDIRNFVDARDEMDFEFTPIQSLSLWEIASDSRWVSRFSFLCCRIVNCQLLIWNQTLNF